MGVYSKLGSAMATPGPLLRRKRKTNAHSLYIWALGCPRVRERMPGVWWAPRARVVRRRHRAWQVAHDGTKGYGCAAHVVYRVREIHGIVLLQNPTAGAPSSIGEDALDATCCPTD